MLAPKRGTRVAFIGRPGFAYLMHTICRMLHLQVILASAVIKFIDWLSLSALLIVPQIDGMRMDLVKPRYDTYDELYEYCYKVAGTVGLMTTPVMGVDPSYTVSSNTRPASMAPLGQGFYLLGQGPVCPVGGAVLKLRGGRSHAFALYLLHYTAVVPAMCRALLLYDAQHHCHIILRCCCSAW